MFSNIYGEFPPKKLITLRSSCGIGARQPICHVIRGVGTDGMDGKRGRTCCCSTTTFFSLCRLFLSPESALPASVPNWWFDADYSAQYFANSSKSTFPPDSRSEEHTSELQ